MGSVSFTMLDHQSFTNSVVTGNGVFTLYTGNTQNNSVGLEKLRAVIDYEAALPSWPPSDASYSLSLLIEGISPGTSSWFPLAYQFEPFNYADNGRKRIIHLDPTISDFNAGIDDVMYVGGSTIARISRQQGRLGVSWRPKIVIQENGFGTSLAFQSAVISLSCEAW